MPAAKLRPMRPSTTAVPPVMYSQPWSPTPSTTASAPELRTQNRSPTTPRRNTSPGRGPVEDHVARDDVLLGDERAPRVRAQCDPSAGQPLADVVVRVADQPQGDAARQERAEALAGRAGERDVDGVVGQAVGAPALGHLVAEHGADGAVDVAHRQVQPDLVAGAQRTLAELDEGVVQRASPARGPGRWCSAGRRPRAARACGRSASGPARRSSSGARPCRRRGPRSARRPPRSTGSRARRGTRGPPAR